MSSGGKPPKAFLSHASEDKERFVLPFAAALRKAGIDAWVDKWEIKLGDSIVRKIFEEGIGKADAALVVLSRISVTKPWVREELDSAFVAKVEGRLRLIPVVIEDCEIPVSLKHLLRVRVKDLNSFQQQIDEIAKVLFGVSIKPPLGTPTAYLTQPPLVAIPGLESGDIQVLVELGKAYLTASRGPIDRSVLEHALYGVGMSPASIGESCEMLEGEGLVTGIHALAGKFFLVSLTGAGREIAFRYLVPQFEEYKHRIALEVVNQHQSEAQEMAESLNIPFAIVEHVLDELVAQGLIKAAKTLQGMMVFDVSPRLRRAMK